MHASTSADGAPRRHHTAIAIAEVSADGGTGAGCRSTAVHFQMPVRLRRRRGRLVLADGRWPRIRNKRHPIIGEWSASSATPSARASWCSRRRTARSLTCYHRTCRPATSTRLSSRSRRRLGHPFKTTSKAVPPAHHIGQPSLRRGEQIGRVEQQRLQRPIAWQFRCSLPGGLKPVRSAFGGTIDRHSARANSPPATNAMGQRRGARRARGCRDQNFRSRERRSGPARATSCSRRPGHCGAAKTRRRSTATADPQIHPGIWSST